MQRSMINVLSMVPLNILGIPKFRETSRLIYLKKEPGICGTIFHYSSFTYLVFQPLNIQITIHAMHNRNFMCRFF